MEDSLSAAQPLAGTPGTAPDLSPEPAADLAMVKRMAQEALDMGSESRLRSTLCLQYYHKKQLTAEEKATLRRRKQPDTVINRVRSAVNGTLGVLEQGRTDPKAWPRNPADEQSADVATKALRYIADANEFQDQRVASARDYLIQHAAAVIVGVGASGRPLIEDIAPEEFLFDPRSRKEDFRDARYLGIAKWLYADELAALHRDKEKEIEAAIDSAAPIPVDHALEDRPNGSGGGGASWVDRRQRRLLVIELYYRQAGRWLRCLFHSGGILEAGVSAYLDGDGVPSCPIVAQSCYVDDENLRYGVVFDMLDYQDAINKRHSKSLHLINSRQARVSPAAGIDANDARIELSRPDGILLAERGDVEVLPHQDMTAGNMQMLTFMLGEMERAGPNPAVLGRGGESQSGRANLVRQQAGLVELAVVFAGIEAWERRVYRKAWEVARQYWTAPDWIRVSDDEGAPKFVGINQPVAGPPMVGIGPDGLATIQPSVLGYDNALAELDVDITLDSVPDSATLQQEQFQALADLARVYGPQEVPFEDMLALSSIPDKARIIERRKARADNAAEAAQAAQAAAMQAGQQAQQVQLAGAEAAIREKASRAVLNESRAMEIQQGLVEGAYRAGVRQG